MHRLPNLSSYEVECGGVDEIDVDYQPYSMGTICGTYRMV